MLKEIKTYIIGILISVAVGLLSSFLTMDSMAIYETIAQPALAPPGGIFPIVWSILYVLMGISSVIIYESDASTEDKRQAFIPYVLQLAVNFFWSLLFFNQRAFLASFVWLVFLWILIVAMILSFSKINKTAAVLQIPYLLWVTFAGYLNYMIYTLN